jgi:hypothetical protein
MSSTTSSSNNDAAERRMLARKASQHNHETAGTLAVPKQEKKETKKLAGWKHAVSGFVAGIFEVLGTMPLDVAKTNMQLNPGKYSGPVDALVKIGRAGGPKALYYGTTPFMLQTAGKAAVSFL